MNDPIVDEVRRARDTYAARFNYDLNAIFRDLKEKERNGGRPIVPPVPKNAEPSQPLLTDTIDISRSAGAASPKTIPAE